MWVKSSLIHVEHLLNASVGRCLIRFLLDSVIFVNDLVISGAVKSIQLAVSVVFWSDTVVTNLMLELLEDLLTVLVDRLSAKYVQEEKHSVVLVNLHI